MTIRYRSTIAAVLAATLTLAGSAVADVVYLKSGISMRGKVRDLGDRVQIEGASSSTTLSRDEVDHIEYGDDLYVTLDDRRRALDPRNAEQHYELAMWAAQNKLDAAARGLLMTAVSIQPDYPAASMALGRVFLDGAWVSPDALTDTVRRWSQGGQNAAALRVGRQSLAGLLSPAERAGLLEVVATAARQSGQFAQAAGDYRELAALVTQGDNRYDRFATSAEVLRETPAGLYLVQMDASVVGDAGIERSIPRSGFYSLADNAVMDFALRDKAKSLVVQGQAMMAAAKTAEIGDPAKSVASYNQAEDVFARADQINAGIARSYRIEIRHRLIQIRQASANAIAIKFDGLMRALPELYESYRKTGNGAAYDRQIGSMQGLLNDIQRDLDQILDLGKSYPQELNLFINQAHWDLAHVKAMRNLLTQEQKRPSLPGNK